MSATGPSLSAEQVGASFTSDPDLILPERPRLIPELEIESFGESGLLFDGVRGLQVLGGRSTRTLLPQILPALDGRRTMDELAALFPQIARRTLHDVIALLYSRGLIEEGLAAPPPRGLEDLDSFLGRYVDATRVNRSRGAALERLAASRVGIAGAPEAAALLVEQLSGCGLGELRPLASRPVHLRGLTFVVGVATRETDDLAPVFQAAHEQSVRSMYVRIGAGAAQIGPLFVPGQSACYGCMQEVAGSGIGGDADPAAAALWLSLAALQAFQLLSRVGDPRLYNAFDRYETTPQGLVQTDVAVARMPGCAHCRVGGPKLDPASPEAAAWLLHSSVAPPPREHSNPRLHQGHYSAANAALSRQLKESPPEPYYGARSCALPAPKPLDVPVPWQAAGTPRARPDRAELATLLAYVAGYNENRSGGRWRMAPTGGGLGSPELFAVVRDVEGLPEGVYHYDAARHRLEHLRPTLTTAWAEALGLAREPAAPCLIVGAGLLERLRGKYTSFAVRLLGLDAGVALGYLQDVASALGIGVTEYPDFHDQALAEAIGLHTVGNRQVPTFAVAVGRAAGSGGITGPLDGFIEESAMPARRRSPSRPAAATAAARKVERVDSLFGALLRQRRSTRVFSGHAMPESALRSLVVLARDIVDVRCRSGAAAEVQPWLVLNVASGALEPGVYRPRAGDPAELEQVRGCRPEHTEECLAQRSLGSAPAVLFVTGDFGRALEERGPRGYRDLLMQAGSAIGRAHVAATAYGLAACPSGGVVEEGFRALAQTDGYRDCPLFALSLGLPRSE
jgi:SagB-type dehydrogenase family enzyme